MLSFYVDFYTEHILTRMVRYPTKSFTGSEKAMNQVQDQNKFTILSGHGTNSKIFNAFSSSSMTGLVV